MELTSIILKPRLTEKTQNMRNFKNPKMSFLVHKNANKNQIGVAFKALFGIKPESINTVNRKPSPARFMNKSRHNFHKAFKVAFVTVKTEDFKNLQDQLIKGGEMEKIQEAIEDKGEDGN